MFWSAFRRVGLARPKPVILVGQASLSLRRTGTIVAITQMMQLYWSEVPFYIITNVGKGWVFGRALNRPPDVRTHLSGRPRNSSTHAPT
jgi:hypothetical protein